MIRRTILMLAAVFAAAAASAAGAPKYKYETVPNDPLKARIYTLDNGLKVYMTVNRETPRIQTYIAVKVGGKNDPAETTGLAHYFEHLMFKGSESFGTSDYAAEKVLLDRIEQQFEVYRKTTDEAGRKAVYAKIDSLSYQASKYAIPNEYDKLMAAIGAQGTNAYTSFDQTVYIEDIPSNQIENWARIQADRFANNVIRGFHTELETVYEEKNMSLTNDGRKVYESMFAALFPTHPYGTQTVLGTQEHLKNPSIVNIKNYHKTYYVPNNMAICLSGDFDPDGMIAVIDKYFGPMKPNRNLPALRTGDMKPVASPVVKEVLGLDAANISMGWRINGAASQDADMMELLSSILYNDKAGLMDVDLLQQQKILSGYAFHYGLSDYGMLYVNARPKAGQTLEEVRDLILAEVAKIRNGEFDEGLLKATLNNYKEHIMRVMDSNEGRADAFVNCFVNNIPWKDHVEMLERMSGITKADIVKFAREKLGPESYAVVYKREGKDPNETKIEKPQITPIETNRDAVSDFLARVRLSQVEPIEPVFLDYDRDLSRKDIKPGLEVLYKHNPANDLFTLIYLFDTGSERDPVAPLAFNYLQYLGTDKMTLEQINMELYKLACSYNVISSGRRSYVTISGLSENMTRAMEIVEELMAGAKPDETVLAGVKADRAQSRANAKLNQSQNFVALRRYMTYGPEYIKAVTLDDARLQTITSAELIERINGLNSMEHRVLYYGPKNEKEVLDEIGRLHRVPAQMTMVDKKSKYLPLPAADNKVVLAHYDAKQIYMVQNSVREGDFYDASRDAVQNVFNEYFGGSMNAIVFQEMREARGLAYTAQAWYDSPGYKGEPYTFMAFIATQNDKMNDAITAFEEIINDMPRSENSFNLAKEAIISRMRTERVIKESVLWNYVNAQDMGVDHDRRKNIFEKVQNMGMEDVVEFQSENIKDRKYTYGILGDEADLDMGVLEAIGPIERVSREEIFGY